MVSAGCTSWRDRSAFSSAQRIRPCSVSDRCPDGPGSDGGSLRGGSLAGAGQVAVDVAVGLCQRRVERPGAVELASMPLGRRDLFLLAGDLFTRFLAVRRRVLDFGVQLSADEHGEG